MRINKNKPNVHLERKKIVTEATKDKTAQKKDVNRYEWIYKHRLSDEITNMKRDNFVPKLFDNKCICGTLCGAECGTRCGCDGTKCGSNCASKNKIK
ncbi:MAG: hypothetical protein ABIE74_03800 [Pseudomonadota bacterium]